jgi:hypothetical protein
VRDFWVPREVPRLRHPITALTFLRVRKKGREGGRERKEDAKTTVSYDSRSRRYKRLLSRH